MRKKEPDGKGPDNGLNDHEYPLPEGEGFNRRRLGFELLIRAVDHIRLCLSPGAKGKGPIQSIWPRTSK